VKSTHKKDLVLPGVVCILYVGMRWSMTDFAQNSGRGGRAGEQVDSGVLVENGEVKWTMKQESGDLDVKVMDMCIIGSGRRRGLISGYLDSKRVDCNDSEMASCNRCGEGAQGGGTGRGRQMRSKGRGIGS
jgi:hypothetical protein